MADKQNVWSVHMMEYYSAMKRMEVLIHVTTRVNLGDTMLSERSQSPDLTVRNCVLYEMSTRGETVEPENRLAGRVGGAGSKDRRLRELHLGNQHSGDGTAL